MKYTENLRLKKPEATDYYDIGAFNDNAEEIDLRMKELMDAREAIDREISELKKSAGDGKSAIASAITDMGGGASPDDTYSEMAAKIRLLSPDITWEENRLMVSIGGKEAVGDILPAYEGLTVYPGTADRTLFSNGSRCYFKGDCKVKSLGGNAGAAQVLEGTTFSSDSAGREAEGTMPDNGIVNKVLAAGSSFTIPEGYHAGYGKVIAMSVEEQVESIGAMTYTPGIADRTIIQAGYYITGDQVLKGSSNLAAGNILSGVTIFSATGNVPNVGKKMEYCSRSSSLTTLGIIPVYEINFTLENGMATTGASFTTSRAADIFTFGLATLLSSSEMYIMRLVATTASDRNENDRWKIVTVDMLDRGIMMELGNGCAAKFYLKAGTADCIGVQLLETVLSSVSFGLVFYTL